MVITLSPKQQSYVEDLLKSGHYTSEEEVLTAALENLLEDEATTAATEEKLQRSLERIETEGVRSGGSDLKLRVQQRVRALLEEQR